jgi:hypothetical protein
VPLPMVHLAVAVSLSEKDGGFPSPDFLLGNIAPDAIHMRLNMSQRDKERVHLMELGVTSQELVQLFRAQYGMDKTQKKGFVGGYLTHLLTDRLWWETVIAPFRKKLPPILQEPDIRRLYYRDTDQIDIDLYLQMPWRAKAWSSLGSSSAMDFPPFLTAGEITQWRDRTILWFDDPKHNPLAEPVYITRVDTQDFIEWASNVIAGLLAEERTPQTTRE